MKMETSNKYSTAENYRISTGIGYLPDNVAEWLQIHYSTIVFSFCNTDVENGYGTRITRFIEILRPYKKCVNCNYHSLWNPNDDNSKCRRHTYEKGWEVVFRYNMDKEMSLEEAFTEFLKRQPKNEADPVVFYQN